MRCIQVQLESCRLFHCVVFPWSIFAYHLVSCHGDNEVVLYLVGSPIDCTQGPYHTSHGTCYVPTAIIKSKHVPCFQDSRMQRWTRELAIMDRLWMHCLTQKKKTNMSSIDCVVNRCFMSLVWLLLLFGNWVLVIGFQSEESPARFER